MIEHLEFITPCFCAGANQLVAEVRPSALRGELRWWFRCLGGSKAQEDLVFGVASGNGNSSCVTVRVLNENRVSEPYSPTFIPPNGPQAYLHYLLSVPDDNDNTRMWIKPPSKESNGRGVVRSESQIPPGSTFEMQILITRLIKDERAGQIFAECINYFLYFGAVGYRMTRGFGAWFAPDRLCSKEELETKLKALDRKGFSHELSAASSSDSLQVLRQVEGRLKGDKEKKTGLRYHHPAKDTESPLGFSHGPGERQTSAIRFRPCAFKTKKGERQFSLLLLQAPDSVLGKAVKNAYAGRTRLIPE